MMSFRKLTRRTALTLTAVAALSLTGIAGANAAEKVKVGVFPVTSALPFFVALERGYFKDVDIDAEMVRLIGGPALVAAMITNDIDVAANLVTIEAPTAVRVDLIKNSSRIFLCIVRKHPVFENKEALLKALAGCSTDLAHEGLVSMAHYWNVVYYLTLYSFRDL